MHKLTYVGIAAILATLATTGLASAQTVPKPGATPPKPAAATPAPIAATPSVIAVSPTVLQPGPADQVAALKVELGKINEGKRQICTVNPLMRWMPPANVGDILPSGKLSRSARAIGKCVPNMAAIRAQTASVAKL